MFCKETPKHAITDEWDSSNGVHSLAWISVVELVLHDKCVVPRTGIERSMDIGDFSVELDAQPQFMMIIVEVFDHDFSMREEVFGVLGEGQGWIITDQGVPVVTEIELWVGFPGVTFVDADQHVVPRVGCKEAPCKMKGGKISHRVIGRGWWRAFVGGCIRSHDAMIKLVESGEKILVLICEKIKTFPQNLQRRRPGDYCDIWWVEQERRTITDNGGIILGSKPEEMTCALRISRSKLIHKSNQSRVQMTSREVLLPKCWVRKEEHSNGQAAHVTSALLN